jgi:hypothetical protein
MRLLNVALIFISLLATMGQTIRADKCFSKLREEIPSKNFAHIMSESIITIDFFGGMYTQVDRLPLRSIA